MEFPSPSSSAYDISLQLPRVNTSGFLSSLTILENERLSRQQLALRSISRFDSTRQTVRQDNTTQLPSEQDFRLLYDRLDQIINKGFTQRKVQLKDDKDFESLLPAKEQQFFKVVVKGKQTPLRVMIKRTRGKLLVFTSKSNSEPSEFSHDDHHKTDRFTIGDSGSNFKLEQIYIGFQAVEDCYFSVKIIFGRAPIALGRTRVGNAADHRGEDHAETLARQELEKRVEEAIIRRVYEAKYAVPDKNFITSNIKIAASVPTLKRQTMSARIITHTARRVKAQEKKLELIAQKRVRTINSLNRHISRLQETKKSKDLMTLLLLKQRWQQLWLTPVAVAKGLDEMHARFVEARRRFLESKKRSVSAMRIQLMFRRWRRDLASEELCLATAVNSLTYYSKHVKQLGLLKTHRQIQLCISSSAANSALPRRFETFFSQGKP
jgi:hypothetical protein